MWGMEAHLGRTSAAAVLGIHPATLDSWVLKGLVPTYQKPSGLRYWLASDLEAIRRRRARPVKNPNSVRGGLERQARKRLREGGDA